MSKTLFEELLTAVGSSPYRQRRVIEGYLGNPIVDEALRNKRSVAQKVEELMAKHPPKRRILPRRTTSEHNHEVEELSELVTGAAVLKSESFFGQDSFVKGAGLGAPLGFAINAVNSSTAQLFGDRIDSETFIVLPAFAALCFGAASYFASDKSSEAKSIRWQAKYIDERIEALYSGAEKIGVLDTFLNLARARGISKGELLGRGFVAHWQASREHIEKGIFRVVDPLTGKVCDDLNDAPVVGLYYPSIPRRIDDNTECQLGLRVEGRFDPKIIRIKGDSYRGTYDAHSPAKDPFALVAQGKIVPEKYFLNFSVDRFVEGHHPNDTGGFIAFEIKDGVVDVGKATGVFVESEKIVKSLIAEKVPVDYRGVFHWALNEYCRPTGKPLSKSWFTREFE